MDLTVVFCAGINQLLLEKPMTHSIAELMLLCGQELFLWALHHNKSDISWI